MKHSCSVLCDSRVDVLMDGYFMCSETDVFYYPVLTVNCEYIMNCPLRNYIENNREI